MYFARNGDQIDYDLFLDVFGGLMFNGVSTLTKVGTNFRTTKLISQTTSSSTWDSNVMEKFRKIIKTSNMKLKQVFEMFDEDQNGFITPIEFRNAVRKLNLNLSAREIDEIIKIVDRNMDGMIDWNEFSAKFKTKANEVLIETRAHNKMARLKEQMTLHMKSPQDAFDLFDKSKAGKLSFNNFNDLIIELSKLSKNEVPPFSIIKDLFDEIDIRKDGELDTHEWNQTFIAVQGGDKTYSLKKLAPSVAEFEVSRDAKIIREAIRKNRKFLIENFTAISADGNHVSFEEAKEIIRAIQRGKEINDDEYMIIFKGAIREGGMVEFKKLGKK
jgi:Ca2+-binding EF-hand superfamily protein